MTAVRADRAGISWLRAPALVLGLLAGLAVFAAPASALPLPAITINGASPTASGPTVNASLDSRGSLGGGALYVLTVDFPSSNATGDEITSVSGQFNSAEASSVSGFISVDEEVAPSNLGGLFSFFTKGEQCFTVGGQPRSSFSCPNDFGGFDPGVEQSYVITTTQNPNDPTPLSSLNFTVNMCGQASSHAIVAAVNCAPPGPTKITKTKIDQHKRTASFQYKAKRAQHYKCELIHKQKVVYRASCGSKKKYANPLNHGQYAFIVWGVNAGGGSAKAAVKKFKIG